MSVALIITHENPDLDALGFVYSARKKFGFHVPVECRRPSRGELENPEVVVGDVGLPDCLELNYNPSLNNFDHHFGCAKNSATFLFNQEYNVLRRDIVSYIDDVDLGRRREEAEVNLNVAIAGVRAVHYGNDAEIVGEGCWVLKYIEDECIRPDRLPEDLPEKLRAYVQAGLEELERIREELARMVQFRTGRGRSAGYVQTSSKIFSLVGDILLAGNPALDIVIVHNPSQKRYSIRSNTSKSNWVNLLEEGVIESLNEAERQGRWGGREDRVGSPRPDGSSLSCREVLEILKGKL